MPLDVVHLIHQYPPESEGGSEQYLRDLVGRQRAAGRTVEIVSGTKHWRPTLQWATDEVDGVPVHRVHRDDAWFEHYARMWHPGVEQAFEEFLRARRPSIVHVHHWIRLTCNLVEVCRRQGVPAVVTLHDHYTSCPRIFRSRPDDPACQRPIAASHCAPCVTRHGHESQQELEAGVALYADQYRSELGLAHAVLVSVDGTADLLSRTTGVPRDRYETLPLGYRPRFAGMPRLEGPRAGEPVRFAFWGVVGRHKGILVLLRALRSLVATHPGRAELHILGGFESPAFESELRAASADLPVRIHGSFDATQLHAVGPHVGVFPSICIETYGQVLDECLELRLPCVVSDIGAFRGRGGDAFLTAVPGDDASLASAMRRFVEDPDAWGRLRDALPSAPKDRAAHAEALERIYERCRSGASAPRGGEPVAASRRVAYLQMQRDSAIVRVARPGGPA